MVKLVDTADLKSAEEIRTSSNLVTRTIGATMKIAVKSNYDRDTYEEKFLEPIPVTTDTNRLQKICNMLNELHQVGPDYYCVVPSHYKLKKREY